MPIYAPLGRALKNIPYWRLSSRIDRSYLPASYSSNRVAQNNPHLVVGAYKLNEVVERPGQSCAQAHTQQIAR